MKHGHGTYIGPIEHLKGKTALLRDGFGPTTILAQFDDMEATLDGQPVPERSILEYEPHSRFPTLQVVDCEDPPPGALGFGWHQFHPWEFQLDEREES